jgi:hypothetical protein
MQNISQNHFRIIAIRPITPPNMDYMGDEEKRQNHSIQKAVAYIVRNSVGIIGQKQSFTSLLKLISRQSQSHR